MKRSHVVWFVAGLLVALGALELPLGRPERAFAGTDRHEDFILCTGPVALAPRALTDGVWLLDYRSGKLLATVIDRVAGKLIGWAELDLPAEFDVAPRANVHFLMTTGSITSGQAALYVAETTSGKFGVYTMGPRSDGQPGLAIRRHDLTTFRPSSKPAESTATP